MSKVNRRRFLSHAATGVGSAVTYAACSSGGENAPASQAPASLAPASQAPAAPARRQLIEPLLTTPVTGAAATQSVTLKMIIRGLCGIIIRRTQSGAVDYVDLVLMDGRGMAHAGGTTHVEHIGRFSTESRYVVTSGGGSAGEVSQELEPLFEQISTWDIRGSLVTIDSNNPQAARITINENTDERPWSSMKLHFDLEDIYPAGRLRSSESLQQDRTSDGMPRHSVAAIIRLTHGTLESALPSRRYANTGIWQMIRSEALAAGEIPAMWRQGLTDTALYTLELPAGEVQLLRAPLPSYSPPTATRVREGKTFDEPTHAVDTTPIVLTFSRDPNEPGFRDLPCAITHEPTYTAREHNSFLVHNQAYFELFENPPAPRDRHVPQIVDHWNDRGIHWESRSPYWRVVKDPKTGHMGVTVCDPNCNLAAAGVNRRRNVTKTRIQP